jgi:hypothetical protein
VIVGQRFRGISRASWQGLSFIAAYTLYGIPVLFLVELFFSESGQLGVFEALLFFHFVPIISMLPAAILGNFVALRVLGWRSWRRERWRARVAGILAIPVVWAGGWVSYPLALKIAPWTVRSIQAEWGIPIALLGGVVTFSNLCLLAAWLLPPWKKRATSSR